MNIAANSGDRNNSTDIDLKSAAPLYMVGINTKIIGKTAPQNLSYKGAWKEAVFSLSELADHIGKGHPWMPALLNGGGERWQSNANHAEVLAIDIDAGMTIDEALEHPFVVGCAGLLIESASSTTEHHKFRIVFALPEPIKDWQSIRWANRFLADQIGHADPACKDASRYFFGAPGREPILLNLDAKLPADFIEQSNAWRGAIEAEEQRRAEAAKKQFEEWKSAHSENDAEALVMQALDAIPVASVDYGEWLAIGMSLAGMGDQWFAAWDDWSSSDSRYNAKEMSARWKSFRGKQATPGVIFGIAKRHGFKFPQAKKSKTLIKKHAGKGFAMTQTIAAPSALPVPDLDMEEEREDYQRAIGRADAKIDFDRLLHPKLGQLIRATAATLPVNPELTYLHYRSVMASIVGTRAKLVIRPGWAQGLTCWTMGIADPGAKKSANLDKLIAPLTTLQEESKQAYDRDLKEYDARYRVWSKEVKEDPQLEEPEKPAQREWFVVDATMESLAPMLDKSPYQGVVSVHDELGSWFDKMDAYRNGGGDRANWLSLINGGSLKVNRKDVSKNIFVKKTAVSITGSTQPETLDRMMRESKDTNDGLWDRFRIATGRFTSIRDRGQAFDSDPHFLQLYRNLDAMPERLYQLSPAAERLFFEFECWVEDQRCQVSKRFYSALNKMQWKLAVETLALHLEDAAIEGNINPTAQIPKSTVERALVAINYDILQMRILHDRMVEQVLDAKIMGAIELCKKGDGTITPRQMQHTRLVKNAAEGHALIDQMIEKFLGVEDEELSTARKRVFRYVDGGIVNEADGFVVPESIEEPPIPQFVEPLVPGDYAIVQSDDAAPDLAEGTLVMVVRVDDGVATVADQTDYLNHIIPLSELSKTEAPADFSVVSG